VQVNVVHCRGYIRQRGSRLSEEKTWGSEPYWGLDTTGIPTGETKKLDAKGKRALADELLAQAAEDEAKEPIGR
jgi:hypothetical protein